MGILEIASLIVIFFLVGFWEYVNSFRLRNLPIRHEQGFAVFALIGWAATAVILIQVFGYLFGLLTFFAVLTMLQYVTHFTIGLLLSRFFPYNSDWSLATYSVLVLTLVILAVLNILL